MGGSPLEEAVARARRAATLDTIETALGAGIDRAIVLTDDDSFEPDMDGVEVVVGEGDYHFGRSLAGIVGDRRLRSVIYIGGGSLPLLGAGEFREIVRRLESSIAVTNNRFSSDLVAWNADSAGFGPVRAQERDNSLARALHESGVQMQEQPRTLRTVLDIDSPSDLAVLAVTGLGGRRLREAVAGLELDEAPYSRLLPVLIDRTREVVVAGRVGTHVWQYLEGETACRIRVFAEERGLEADARAEAGEARSVIGFLLEAVGTERFFEIIGELGDAAAIDTRVLLAHAGVRATRADRFLSDARMQDGIEDPFLRGFTRAAIAAPVPVLLGGHSLVTGGLMALNETAWERSEAGLLAAE